MNTPLLLAVIMAIYAAAQFVTEKGDTDALRAKDAIAHAKILPTLKKDSCNDEAD